MTQAIDPLVHQAELRELWWNLLPRRRRALCVLANIDPDEICEISQWSELPTAYRVGIVRAMREWGEYAVEFALALASARRSLDANRAS